MLVKKPSVESILHSWLGQKVLVHPPGNTKHVLMVGILRHDGGWCIESNGRKERIEVRPTEFDDHRRFIRSAETSQPDGHDFQGIWNRIFTSHFNYR